MTFAPANLAGEERRDANFSENHHTTQNRLLSFGSKIKLGQALRFYGDRLALDKRYLTFFDHGIFGKGFAARPKEQAFDANHTNPVAA